VDDPTRVDPVSLLTRPSAGLARSNRAHGPTNRCRPPRARPASLASRGRAGCRPALRPGAVCSCRSACGGRNARSGTDRRSMERRWPVTAQVTIARLIGKVDDDVGRGAIAARIGALGPNHRTGIEAARAFLSALLLGHSLVLAGAQPYGSSSPAFGFSPFFDLAPLGAFLPPGSV